MKRERKCTPLPDETMKDLVYREKHTLVGMQMWMDYLGWHWIQNSTVFICMNVSKTMSIDVFVKLNDFGVWDNAYSQGNLLRFVSKSALMLQYI